MCQRPRPTLKLGLNSDRWEIDRADIEIDSTRLGEGNFGTVNKVLDMLRLGKIKATIVLSSSGNLEGEDRSGRQDAEERGRGRPERPDQRNRSHEDDAPPQPCSGMKVGIESFDRLRWQMKKAS